ncbi:MAG: HEAT repeat domain-containing protein [Chlamydiales bacterium]|nr:HEAT repeat domain-containing protein [Chlamydiales bacterium]
MSNQRWFIVMCFCFPLLLFAGVQSEEERLSRRVFAYLKIGEYDCGLKEVYQALTINPNSQLLQEALIRLLAKSGKERECYLAWQKYQASFTSPELRRDLLEEMAWGTLYKGISSPTLYARLIALVGSTITQDAYAVSIMKKCLKDSNSLVRCVAVELSSHLMDMVLQKQVLFLLEKDPVWQVRMQAIDAVGEMQLKEAEGILKRLLASESATAEEKARIVAAIVGICKDVTAKEVIYFARSDRSGLRLLACALVLELNDKAHLEHIALLVNDSHAEVRIAALSVFGLMRVSEVASKKVVDLIYPCTLDMDYRVAITACWLTTLFDPQKGMQTFAPWLSHKNQEIRRFAAAALGNTGKYGVELASRFMVESRDPFVRVQLALALIGQRVSVERACNEVFCFLSENRSLLMWNTSLSPLFRVLAPSDVRHEPDMILTPEAIDQKVHLDLIHVLAVLEYPRTIEVLKRFLKEKTFGITGVAATVLLQECDSESAFLVRELLGDNDPKIRIQAALVLGMWIHDKEAVTVLQEAYPQADRELKIKILEAIGNIGDPCSTDFLLQAMQDPFLVIRIVAAASLILSLNH